MPVDIALFRSDDEILEEVRKWQNARYGEGASINDLLQSVQSQDAQHRLLLREINVRRTRLNSLKQSMRSSSEKESVRDEVKSLKDEISSHERQLQIAADKLESVLPRIGNYILAPNNRDENDHSTLLNARVLRKASEVVLDPMFCLDGYETFPGKGAVLSGTGAALAYSLSSYTLQFLRSHPTFSLFRPVIFPDMIPINRSTAHSLMGCLPSKCQLCTNNSPIAGSSLVAASLLHQQKTFWDRQLPLGHVITTTTSASNSASTIDKRELTREQSFRTTGKKPPWFEACTRSRIELFCLTGSTVSESNDMQGLMADAILGFYQSLLAVYDDAQHLRMRTATPPELLPCEASRVVIEGLLLGNKFVTLGYVSNMTDYCARGCRTRMGGSLGNFCHSVHGVVCNIPETIEWILGNNVTKDNEELGIVVSSELSIVLQEHLGITPSSAGVLFLPFVRSLHHSKGKLKRTELSSTSKPRVAILQSGSDSTTRLMGSHEPRKAAFIREGPVTVKDIQDERTSCPFDFLPIG